MKKKLKSLKAIAASTIGVVVVICLCIIFNSRPAIKKETPPFENLTISKTPAHIERKTSIGFSPELRNAVMNGVSLSRGKKLDEYVNSHKNEVGALIAAHLLSGDEHYWVLLLDFYRKNPDPCLASYLALSATDKKDRLAFAEETVKLDPNNSLSYLALADARKRNGLNDGVSQALDMAKAAPVLTARSKWFSSELSEALKNNDVDATAIAAAQEHNPWDSKIIALFDLLVVQSSDSQASDVAATIRLLRSAREELDAGSWRTQRLYIDGSELALLSKLPEEWDYDNGQTVKERIKQLGFQRRLALARQSEAMQILQNSQSSQVSEFYSIVNSNGRESAITWLLGPPN